MKRPEAPTLTEDERVTLGFCGKCGEATHLHNTLGRTTNNRVCHLSGSTARELRVERILRDRLADAEERVSNANAQHDELLVRYEALEARVAQAEDERARTNAESYEDGYDQGHADAHADGAAEDRLCRMKAERDALAAQIARVLSFHVAGASGLSCRNDGHSWPCPTARALSPAGATEGGEDR